MFRVFGYSLGESCLIALGTTLISQKVRNPFAISALCGLNQWLASYFLGILFFAAFGMYGFGILSLLYGAVVTGSIGLARFPDVPRWALLAGPLAGTAVYSTLAVVLAVPGFGLGWPILIELMSAAMMGAAFFFAIRSEDMVVQNVKRV
jgi:multisubunit Na+/H+ antiporter MnhG subunit